MCARSPSFGCNSGAGCHERNSLPFRLHHTAIRTAENQPLAPCSSRPWHRLAFISPSCADDNVHDFRRHTEPHRCNACTQSAGDDHVPASLHDVPVGESSTVTRRDEARP
jgi:hypothetical protein